MSLPAHFSVCRLLPVLSICGTNRELGPDVRASVTGSTVGRHLGVVIKPIIASDAVTGA